MIYRPNNLPSQAPVRRLGILIAVAALLAAEPAWAQDGTSAAKINRLNKQALEAFDSLNFDQAKTLLEQALAEADTAGLTTEEPVARTHLNLGMLLIAGFQQKEQAVDHFKAALKAKPDITAPPGLFNPEVQVVFDEVKANRETEPEPPTAAAKPRPTPVARESAGAEAEGEEEEEDADRAGQPTMLLSIGLGSGFGYANSHLDTNKDLVYQNGKLDNSWSGVAPSGLGHIVASAGYYLSRQLVLSLEGRLQIISGTTPTPLSDNCIPSCKPPGTAIAGLVKASWFFSSDTLSPFVSGGVGAGSIRQVVKPNGLTCGTTAEQCVDTVTGGPLLLAVGGGVAYQMGTVALLGSVTTNLAVPNFMLNVDAVLGLALRL